MKFPANIPPLEACVHCGVKRDLDVAQRLQRLMAEISSSFVIHPPGQMDDAIEGIQHLICETLGLDRATLWRFTDDESELVLTHFWQRPGCQALRRNFVTNGNLPWVEGKMKRGESFHFSSLGDLPPEAARDVEVLRAHGTKSNATFPLIVDGKVFGALAFASINAQRAWTEDEIASLELISGVFSHVIRRRQVEERVEQLRDEIQRAARASVLGELAAALAHEINQPLTTILTNAQAARRFIRQGEARPEDMVAILDDIIRDDKRAGEVIRNLRALLADTPVSREPLALNKLISEVTAFLGKIMADAGVDLQFDPAPSLPLVRAARTDIQQVLINLLLNAIHAMSATPLECRRIVIRTDARGPWVSVRVTDHGCGIAPGHLDRIFEPFHTTRADGLGMGLTICRRIVEAHGGRIEARNDESGGAVFVFSLPPQSAPAEAREMRDV